MSKMPKAFKYSGQEKLPISAFIITLNEENNIRQCLASLAFCKEIIVLDSGSTDLTRKIAEEMGAKVQINEFQGYTEQKQLALNLCTHDWVLSLDADERVTEELYQFMAKLDLQNSPIDGYEVKRLHRFLNVWINHSGLYPDYKLRFFRRTKGKFVGQRVHEVVEVDGQTQKLPFDLLHYSWPGIKEYFITQMNYAAKVAENKFEQGKQTSTLAIIFRTLWAFKYRYFIRLAFLDGFAGFVIAFGAALGTAHKYLRLLELQRNNQVKSPYPTNLPLKILLKPAQLFYGLASKMRVKAYELGVLKKHKLSVPVISVGNLTVGGSGKTPFTIWLAKNLSLLGTSKVSILTRGYGKNSSQVSEVLNVQVNSLAEIVGDEPLLMKQNLQAYGTNVLVHPKRIVSGRYATEELKSEALILDDGFQHIQLERSRNICLIDCSDPNFDQLLPLGSRREALSELKRADVFVLTRSEFNLSLKIKYQKLLAELCPGVPVLCLKEEVKKFTNGLSPIEEYPKGKRVMAFCGLGNPNQFFASLQNKGLKIQKTICFRDHHKYSVNDVKKLFEELEDCEADFLITSSKDAVKLFQLDAEGEVSDSCLARLLAEKKLLVAHLDITGFYELPDDMRIQLSNLLGPDIFNTLRPQKAEEIG